MSRLGKVPVAVPKDVKVTVNGRTVEVEGKKGRLSLEMTLDVSAKVEASKVIVERKGGSKQAKAMHGTTRAHIANMVVGVSEGFEKILEVSGSGYNVKMQGKDVLVLTVGWTRPIEMKVPAGLTVECPSPAQVTVRGPDKRAVGQFGAEVRGCRPMEPYKLKGIKYRGEQIKKKAGKAAIGATK
ncbi:MAG: 50S ribosomal protein L6 [Candidatus Handelsmanbacteria bacterium RIFCSPLOWO2_12_FULL_64_10]|uniref:50S ribosomal protein L6 n=1 Tax=Handelsmanbacteria sp. (strain RIFCSPLOWO2_12_FULL_64_10) TaxID=1817868 RepID=A0A1F6CAI7_HANXR|nr:ribosomal protein L6 [uncultured bacterium]OGG45947.1 MAG: 50S ribosomal protein L6 [Candidatus Handelsmanbacteria bacterium RIFCSPLOWO2_12_FULL_64_10]